MSTHYDTDVYAWSQHQAALLREGALTELDLVNLAEEIESVGTRARRDMEDHVAKLLLYLLAWCYWPRPLPDNTPRRTIYTRRGGLQRPTIRTQRRELQRLLAQNPSLRPLVPGVLTEGYREVRREASYQTHLPEETFPVDCPWDDEQVLRGDFWPKPDTP